MAKKKGKSPLTAKEKAILKEAGFDLDAKPVNFRVKRVKRAKPKKPHRHGNFEPYGKFTEGGIEVTAQICNVGDCHFVVTFKKGKRLLEELSLPALMYGARFGVDVSDADMLEGETDKVLRKLKKKAMSP